MNKKIFISLTLLFSLGLWSAKTDYAFCAEIFDVPQNTDSQEDIIIEEKDSKTPVNEESFSSKELQEEKVKPEKTKKFFTKTERAEKVKKQDQTSNEGTTDVLVDSDSIEYFPERHEFEAVGNAKVTFPAENSVLIADKIIFNHDTNYIKGYGNVVLVKEGQKVNGDYIQVDLNDNNALMNNPVLNHLAIKIKAKTGIVYDAQTEALDGTVTFNDKTQYRFWSRPIMGFNNPMMDEAIPTQLYFKEKYDNKWRLKAKTIIIDSYKDRDVATLKNADLYIQDTKMASAGKIKLYTDKEQQYIETNMLELGSLRNIGAFVSPGFVFQTPNSSTLKLGPALTYDHEIGVGAVGRFLTDKNRTDFGYGTSKSKIVVRGEQEFTENLRLQYGINSYMNNWFLGGRMPKYGFQFIHHKAYDLDDIGVNFQNRFTAGYAKDWNRTFSTTKASWMTQSTKSLFSYKNTDSKFAADFGLSLQTSASLYGTGDTMGVLRAGPYLRTQYKAWQQYLAYYQGAVAGDSPMNYDKYYYGRSSIQLGESLRICRYLTLMYAGTIVLSDDTPNDNMFQENRIYFAVGPDDLKFLIGYDVYRQNASMGVIMNVGAENSDVEFKRLILNDPQAIGKHNKSEKERMAAQKKKAEEEKKKKESDPMNRSVKDYRDYNPGFNMMPGGALLQPSLIRPPGM
ncbi:MAG: hypothetical protein KHX03_02875 [Clostridium sp.]|nr:hypothetical protein [Clostridium sp.]